MINRLLPETDCTYAGYSALIEKYELAVPLPFRLAAISSKHKKYETKDWLVFTPRHAPEDNLYSQLTFALKYEGIDLTVLSSLFSAIDETKLVNIIKSEPNGAYARRIWFLYEWITQKTLDVPDLKQGNFVNLVDEKIQYGASPRPSKRHRIKNNLPGVRYFCPLIRRTKKLDDFISKDLSSLAKENIGSVHPDVLMRAAAFLLLKDSRASYAIENEKPPHNRIERWGRIIGRAGQVPLSKQEFEKLQKEVLKDSRFIKLGYRTEGGFIGEHDRETSMPIPDHISARFDDLEDLMASLIETIELLKNSEFPPVLAAAMIAFGFVFIHPFADGNGRLHRYLFHHVLAENGFTPKEIVFPVSSVMYSRMIDYKAVLESYSAPRLSFIEWRPTEKNNVEVLNETIDLYRYFDATNQAEFFYECVYETIVDTLPKEVDFLQKYDRLKTFIDNYIDMPNHLVDLLIRFLHQNNGKLSKRALSKEFSALTKEEIGIFEGKYAEVFND